MYAISITLSQDANDDDETNAITAMEAAMRTVSTIAPLRSIQHKDSLGNPIGRMPLSLPRSSRVTY